MFIVHRESESDSSDPRGRTTASTDGSPRNRVRKQLRRIAVERERTIFAGKTRNEVVSAPDGKYPRCFNLSHDRGSFGSTLEISIHVGRWRGSIPSSRAPLPHYAVVAWFTMNARANCQRSKMSFDSLNAKRSSNGVATRRLIPPAMQVRLSDAARRDALADRSLLTRKQTRYT